MEGWDYYISLFPVSKYQFERFMAEEGPRRGLYTDRWYRDILRGNPRRSWKRCEERPWELFLTGVSMEGIVPFLKYLGRGYRLPEVDEWKGLLGVEGELRRMESHLKEMCRGQSAPPVILWIERGLFPLVSEGLIEMLEGGEYIGRPYQGLLPNTWSPGDVREVNWDVCAHVVGFRVVRQG